MMSFEEYLNTNYNEKLDDLTKFLINDAFKAGAQSRQKEIDELQRKLNLCEALRNNQFEHLIEITEQRDTSQKSVIELQKRIDNLTNTNEYLVAYKNQLLNDIEGNKND